jgi:hypothetical protein
VLLAWLRDDRLPNVCPLLVLARACSVVRADAGPDYVLYGPGVSARQPIRARLLLLTD